MKIKIILCLLIFSFSVLLGCSSLYNNSGNQAALHKGDPYQALKYIDGIQINDNNEEVTDKLLMILKKYSSDAYYLIQRMEALPLKVGFPGYMVFRNVSSTRTTSINGRITVQRLTEKGYKRWLDTSKPFINQVMDLSTAVHEESHGYTSVFALFLFSKKLSDAGRLTYMENGRKRLIRFNTLYRNKNSNLYVLERSISNSQYTLAFPALWIAPVVPQEKRTFRFNTYIINRNQSTNTVGFSGLLDEYNSYYWSNKVIYDLYDYFRLEQEQTPEYWIKWLQSIMGYYFSYAEFRYWILNYLYMAKTKYKGVYKSLMTDKVLRSAFTLIDDDFTHLIHKIFNRLFIELPAQLKKFGYKTSVKSSTTLIKNKKMKRFYYQIGNRSITLFEYEYLPLQEELLKPKFKDIADEFRISPAKPFPILKFPDTLRAR